MFRDRDLNLICTPLKSLNLSLDIKEQQVIGKIVGDASVVGLGEATHGTSEFIRMRFEIIKYLVTQLGFTILSLEASMPDCENVNEYILGEKSTFNPRKLAPWNCAEFYEIIEWMKDYNQTAKQKVQLSGFDMQAPETAEKIIKTFFKKQGISLDLKCESISRDHKKLFSPLLNHLLAGDMKKFLESQSEMKHSTLFNNIMHDIRSLKITLDRIKTQIPLPEQKYRWIKQMLRVLEQSTLKLTGESRDQFMAENILWQRAQVPNTKVILWAHNGHLHKDTRCDSIMGKLISERLGDQYRVFAFTTYQGTYSAGRRPDNQLSRNLTLIKPPVGTLDHRIHELGHPVCLMNLHQPESKDFFVDEAKMRCVGAVQEPEDGIYYRYPDVCKSFDAIISIDKTMGSKSLLYSLQLMPMIGFFKKKAKIPYNPHFEPKTPYVLYDEKTRVKMNKRDLLTFSSKPIKASETNPSGYDSARTNTVFRP